MRCDPFSNCCTARILTGWYGKDPQAEQRYQGLVHTPEGTYRNYTEYKAMMEPQLAACINTLTQAEVGLGGFQDVRNLGLIFATVTSLQPFAIRFAKSIGFRATRPTAKGRHTESQLVGLFADSLTLYNWKVAYDER